MIPKNQNLPFRRQNVTPIRHFPLYDVNVTSQTKKLNNLGTTHRKELADPSFCSVWVGESFMQNFSPYTEKYTENEHYDVL